MALARSGEGYGPCPGHEGQALASPHPVAGDPRWQIQKSKKNKKIKNNNKCKIGVDGL